MIKDLNEMFNPNYVMSITNNMFQSSRISIFNLNSDRVLRITLYSNTDLISDYSSSLGSDISHLLSHLVIECGIKQSPSDIIEKSNVYSDLDKMTDEDKENILRNIFNLFSSDHKTLSCYDMNKIQNFLNV